MSDTEKISSTYEVNVEEQLVVCKHAVTTRKTGERYSVVSTHDMSGLTDASVLKLASMQCKIKKQQDMGERAADGETAFFYTWTDEEVDGLRKGKTKVVLTPAEQGNTAVENMTHDERDARAAKIQTMNEALG